MAAVEEKLVPLRQVEGVVLAAAATQRRHERLCHLVDQLLDIEERPSPKAVELIVEIDAMLAEEQNPEGMT
jgi:hypothetical protein